MTTDCLTLKFPELPEADRDSVVLKKNLITKLAGRVRLGKATVTQSLQLVVPTGVSAQRAPAAWWTWEPVGTLTVGIAHSRAISHSDMVCQSSK